MSEASRSVAIAALWAEHQKLAPVFDELAGLPSSSAAIERNLESLSDRLFEFRQAIMALEPESMDDLLIKAECCWRDASGRAAIGERDYCARDVDRLIGDLRRLAVPR